MPECPRTTTDQASAQSRFGRGGIGRMLPVSALAGGPITEALPQPVFSRRRHLGPSAHTGYWYGACVYVLPLGVFHSCQPGWGWGWVTFQPGDCFTRWHFLLRAPALQLQVRPPLSYGWACSKSESRACREHDGKVQV